MKASHLRFFAIACCLIALLSANSPSSSAQTFSATGSMESERIHHAATLLPDGFVLITGGNNGSGSFATAELYNPTAKTFAATGNMTAGRTHHTATLLNDGTVLIAGGYNGDGTHASAELYTPSAGTFAATGAMTTGRADHTATLLSNGMVLIAGGYNGNGTHNSAELYNPATHSFTATGNMTVARTVQSASLLNNGEVLIAAGFNSTYLSSAELYNPTLGTFAATGSLHSAREFHTATVLANGSVLVAGGYSGTYLASAELYSQTAGTFTVTGSLAHARELSTSTLLNNGTVLIAGGYNGAYLSSAELYSQTAGTFSATGSMVAEREASTATLLGADGLVLVAGGYNGSYLATAELYNGPVAEMGIANPLFNIVSIVYDAPGNKSNSGFTNTTTQGTTTTIGSSFMQGDSTTFTIGTDFMGNGTSLSWSFGTATTTGNSSAFTETMTDGAGVANDSIAGNPNVINHVNDLFVIWLNPAVLMTQTGPTSFNYSTGTQLQVAPNPDPGQPEEIDQVEVFAQVMLPNAQGVTTVPTAILIPQIVGSGALQQTLPGLAHICAKPTFYPNSCTLANQCGCVPSDFTAILAADPLINYTPTESPLNANTSTATQCTNPAATAKCRYVPIMSSPTEQVTALLSGPDVAGGNIPVNTFMQSDSTQTAVTLSEAQSVTEGFSWDEKFGVPGFSSDLKSQTTMTWTSTESLGETNGSAHTMTVTLSSSTVGCFENINIFEDIVYHTYVFQQPSGTSCP
jgi:hypothetical protein